MNPTCRFLGLLSALVLLGGAAVAAAGEPAPPGGEGSDSSDLLGLLKRTDRHNLDAGLRRLLEGLDRSKVPTEDKARGAALGAKVKAGTLLAEEGARVSGLLQLGVDVPDFANSGDLVWVVRIVRLGRGVTQEVWVSSTTGAVRSMLPPDTKPGKR